MGKNKNRPEAKKFLEKNFPKKEKPEEINLIYVKSSFHFESGSTKFRVDMTGTHRNIEAVVFKNNSKIYSRGFWSGHANKTNAAKAIQHAMRAKNDQ